MRRRDWNWLVFSLCRGDDPERRPRFFQSVQALDARAVISDLDDSSPTLAPISSDLSEIKSRIRDLVPHSFDVIITHGPHGEYTNHPRHEQVHRAVWDMVESGELKGTLLCFAYDDCSGDCAPNPATDADIYVRLTTDEFARKKEIVRDIYGFGVGSFELSAAGPLESFYSVAGAQFLEDLQDLSANDNQASEGAHSVVVEDDN